MEIFVDSTKHFSECTSGLISDSSYRTSDYKIFAKTSECYLYIYLVLFKKFGIPVFIRFGDIKRWIFLHTVTHARMQARTYAERSSKIIFLGGDSKDFKTCIDQVKTRYKKFWPSTILPLLNCMRVMETKRDREIAWIKFIQFYKENEIPWTKIWFFLLFLIEKKTITLFYQQQLGCRVTLT